MNVSMKLSGFMLLLGLMLMSSGLVYGFMGTSVADGAYCGSAFVKSDGSTLAPAGYDACAVARSDRQVHAWALIVPGIVGMISGGAMMSRETEASRLPATPPSPEYSGEPY